MRLTATILAGLILLPQPAMGHTQPAINEWKHTWVATTWKDRYLQPQEILEYLEFTIRHSLVSAKAATYQPATHPNTGEWQTLLTKYFHPKDMTWATRVMNCESGGNPNAVNPSSSASGLFQHLARYWPERSTKAGWAGSSIFDPEANIAVAAWLYYTEGPQHWVCK